jgi:4-hydroxymandelate oxidase
MTEAGDYETVARERLQPAVYDYFAGGAADRFTVNDNPLAWQRVRLRPRVLRDVGVVDTRTAMLGAPVAAPIGIAPTAAHQLVHADGECATAMGAAEAGMLYVVSTMATCTMEDIAQTAPGAPRWFQLYVRGDLGHARELVRRAEESGYSALMVTVDAPTLDDRGGGGGGGGGGGPRLEQRVTFAHFPSGAAVSDHHVALTFDDLAAIVSWTRLPVLVKGLLRADDAATCVRTGVAGVVVSNHGGSQLDGTVDPPTALAEIASAVGDVAEIYVDGGIRRGTDIVKALALGAHGVLIGRPVIWGLAVAGANGVRAVLEELRAELEMAMKLCGVPTLDDVTPDLVVEP